MKSKKLFKRDGVTLIELTVVILVLLTLISILFIGARAWREGARRAQCILIQRNTQQGVRSAQNLQELNAGDSAKIADLVTDGFLDQDPLPRNPNINDSTPAKYVTAEVIPAADVVYIECSLGDYTNIDAGTGHAPRVFRGW